jgi:hypothetical protein
MEKEEKMNDHKTIGPSFHLGEVYVLVSYFTFIFLMIHLCFVPIFIVVKNKT